LALIQAWIGIDYGSQKNDRQNPWAVHFELAEKWTSSKVLSNMELKLLDRLKTSN